MAQRAFDPGPRWPGMTPLRARSMLFTLYGDYAYPRGRDVRLSALVEFGLALGISEVATRSAVARLANEGWLIARREGNRSNYGLGPAGKRLIDEGIRRIYARDGESWAGRWCVLTYSIPEKRRDVRDRLRKRLAWLGFGAMGPGAYVSPRDAADEARNLLDEHDVGDLARVFSATFRGPGSDASLVAQCWDVPDIGRRYAAFAEHYEPLVDARSGHARLSDAHGFAMRFALTHDFRRFPFVDPGLPDELVPPAWPRSRARKLFASSHASLGPAAARFFDRMASIHG